MRGTDFLYFTLRDLGLDNNTSGREESIYSDQSITRYANQVKDEIVPRIHSEVKSRNIFLFDFQASLIQDQRLYNFPLEFLDTTSLVWVWDGKKYVRAFPAFDVDVRKNDDKEIQRRFSGRSPLYEIRSKGVFLYTGFPIVARYNGLQISSAVYPDDITEDDLESQTDLSEIPDREGHYNLRMPKKIHDYWQKKTSVRIAKSLNQAEPPFLAQELEFEFSNMIQTLLARDESAGVIQQNREFVYTNNYYD